MAYGLFDPTLLSEQTPPMGIMPLPVENTSRLAAMRANVRNPNTFLGRLAGPGGFLSQNANALLGFGAGALSGQRGAGVMGWQQGNAIDQQKRDAAKAEEERKARIAQLQPIVDQLVVDGKWSPAYQELFRAYGEELLPNIMEALAPPDPVPGPIVSGDAATALGLDPTKAYQQHADGTWHQVGSSGTSVEVNLPGQPLIGTIPQGYQATQQEGGGYTMEPVPGGPAASEAEASRRAAAINAAWSDRNTTAMLGSIDSAIGIIQANPTWTTGLGGVVLANLPGSQARTLENTVTTIKAQLGFAQLQAMRDASPTGGALGQVTERELNFLQATLGSLDVTQSPDVILANLQAIRDSLTRYNQAIAAAANGGAEVVPVAAPSATPAASPQATAPAVSPQAPEGASLFNEQTGQYARENPPGSDNWEVYDAQTGQWRAP